MATSNTLRRARRNGAKPQINVPTLKFGEKSKMVSEMVKNGIAEDKKQAWQMIKDGYVLQNQ